MQHTIQKEIAATGTGLHSGAAINIALKPAPAGHGIVFVRTDLPGNNRIPALWNNVTDTRLCTVIANESGASVGTIEHLMAALRGCAVDNILIELNGPEVPAMDGSSKPFVDMIDKAGIAAQNAPRRAIRILKEIVIEEAGKTVTLKPAEEFIFAGEINFDHPDIGRQRYEIKLLNGNFRHDLADSRTFGFFHEVEMMRKAGLALGGSLENAIVLGKDSVMNPEGLRHSDEFIRHKLLDAIGDLYLAGAPILGAYEGVKAGHAMNNAVLRQLFATPGAFEMIELQDVSIPKIRVLEVA
ncbi:MAG: UDP-3-O-acyl-N-acetylglucosamine deacetylase [Alphaproteobacteria bacterium PRO2]|nr:UDP-3-O-acyl-N-acetylglucosamine deacetylase [Alphaproteobacteria bacterium PRO2]